MQITVTVNSDKRYYLDENKIENADHLVETIREFNDMKVALYNELYRKAYGDGRENGTQEAYSSFLKKFAETKGWDTGIAFQPEDPGDGRPVGKPRRKRQGGKAKSGREQKARLSDYYTRAVYSAASGCLKSQKELRDFYCKSAEEAIKNIKDKISSVEEGLAKKKALKGSLKTLAVDGKWKRPYKGCRLKLKKGALLSGSTVLDPACLERKAESQIRGMKTRLALLKDKLRRKEARLERLETLPPERTLFGTKKAYSMKDALETQEERDVWKGVFTWFRHRSMCLPGMHTSKDANYLAKVRGSRLHVTCIDGTEAVFHEFALTRYQEEFASMLNSPRASRRPVAYSFTIRRDPRGRDYITVSVTMTLVNERANYSTDDGIISMDMNWDNICLSDISADGTLLDKKVIRFDLEGKTSGQVTDIIGRAMKEAGDYCASRRKCLSMEDVDTTAAKCGMQYGSKKGNRHASLFASRKITACAMNQGYRQGFEVYLTNPAYTSQAGKMLYMRSMGCSIHEAASYCIGLKGMGRYDMLMPPGWEPAEGRAPGLKDFNTAWRKAVKEYRGIRTHAFYLSPAGLAEKEKKARPPGKDRKPQKRRKEKKLSALLKETDNNNYYSQKNKKSWPPKPVNPHKDTPGPGADHLETDMAASVFV